MKTGRWIAAIVVVIIQVGAASAMSPLGSADELSAKARSLLAADKPRAAVELLEDTVLARTGAPAPLVELLKEAYRKAADQARAGGETQAAEEYLENLTILNRRSPARTPADTASPPASEPTRPPAPAPAPAPEPLPNTEAAPMPPLGAADAPTAPAPLDSPVEPIKTPAAKPQLRVLPPSEELPLPGSASATPSAPPEPSVKEADTDFINKKYLEAGKTYALLASLGKLPANRNDHWAYCRSVEVARRINAGPAGREEWESIDREIAAIKQLSPKSWVGGYLRKLADERSRDAGPRIRGAAPMSNELEIERPLPPVARQEPVARQAPVPRQPAPETLELPRSLAPGATAPRPVATPRPATNSDANEWKILESDNFRIHHHSSELADRVAETAERVRVTQAKRWGGSDPAPWNPRCDIYLYNDGREFAVATKQAETSPGFSTIGIDEGLVTQRRINLRIDHPGMVDAVLPHEITHVVIADFFRQEPIPRWADEGIAVLSEPEAEQLKRAADLVRPLESGRLFRLEDLMRMDFPEGKDWPLYYAQSVSLTQYLVGLESPAKFLDFLEGCRKRPVDAELRRVYRIDGTAALTKAWTAHARRVAQAN